MKSKPLILTLAIASAVLAHAEDQLPENPVAAQFRKHMEEADQNKDGFVTPEELTAEISKDPSRDPNSVKQIVAAMMQNLDTDHDGKISPAEIDNGARKTGQRFTNKQNVKNASLVMSALDKYKKERGGSRPTKLDELAKLGLVPDLALRCTLADGGEKPWGYAAGEQRSKDPNAVVLFSPGQVDSDHQYIIGLNDGRVIGLHDTELELDQIPKLKIGLKPSE